MTLAFFPAMLALGVIVGIIASGTTFWMMRNYKATILMFCAIVSIAAIYAALVLLQSVITIR